MEQIEHFTGSGLYDREFIEVSEEPGRPHAVPSRHCGGAGLQAQGDPLRAAANAGRERPSNNFYRLYDAAMLSITSYTKAGLRLATIIRRVSARSVSIVVGIVYLVMKLIYWDRFPAGMAPMLIGMCFLGSVQIFFIGLVGEYIMSINHQGDEASSGD